MEGDASQRKRVHVTSGTTPGKPAAKKTTDKPTNRSSRRKCLFTEKKHEQVILTANIRRFK